MTTFVRNKLKRKYQDCGQGSHFWGLLLQWLRVTRASDPPAFLCDLTFSRCFFFFGAIL